MKVLIVAATMMEIEPLIESPLMEDCRLIITGVGAVTAAFHLTRMIQEGRPELIIQAGVAGSFDNALAPGSVVIVKQDRFADLGVEENGQWNDVFDMKLANANDEPFNNGWLVNTFEKIKKPGLLL